VATECFCGCGRKIPKFPLGIRSINTRGKQVTERLAFVDDWPHLKNESPEIGEWVVQGKAIVAELEAAVHGDSDPRVLEEGPIRDWQTQGRNIEGFINQHLAAFGKWAKDMGYSEEEAMAAAARGEYRAPGV
jgi:hypothetical protein